VILIHQHHMQTDRQKTCDRNSQDRALHYCDYSASRGKNRTVARFTNTSGGFPAVPIPVQISINPASICSAAAHYR